MKNHAANFIGELAGMFAALYLSFRITEKEAGLGELTFLAWILALAFGALAFGTLWGIITNDDGEDEDDDGE